MNNRQIRVLYSFPHKIGAQRICYTAWEQVNGLADAGADVLLCPGVLHRAVHPSVKIWPTLSRGKIRISYKILGTLQACRLHDYIVAHRLRKLARDIDIIHVWPLAAEQTLKVAAEIGVPTVLERPNAHTRYAYETYARECNRLGVTLPSSHEYAHKPEVLKKEEKEYKLAYRILCPSDFVLSTFMKYGFDRNQLVRHIYGYDQSRFYPKEDSKNNKSLTFISVGVQAVKKGLHYALEAWLKSSAAKDSTFLIVGELAPSYQNKLESMLSHPNIHILGYRRDVPELMRMSDILLLPTIEEGSALVTSEARGSGCVLLVSEAAGANCKHMENALVHEVGDIDTLSYHITLLNKDRRLLDRLRLNSLRTANEITWKAAGKRLYEIYRELIETHSMGIHTIL